MPVSRAIQGPAKRPSKKKTTAVKKTVGKKGPPKKSAAKKIAPKKAPPDQKKPTVGPDRRPKLVSTFRANPSWFSF
jgi:hypothetical protein